MYYHIHTHKNMQLSSLVSRLHKYRCS